MINFLNLHYVDCEAVSPRGKLLFIDCFASLSHDHKNLLWKSIGSWWRRLYDREKEIVLEKTSYETLDKRIFLSWKIESLVPTKNETKFFEELHTLLKSYDRFSRTLAGNLTLKVELKYPAHAGG